MPLYRLQYNISSALFATGIQHTGKIAQKSCHRIKAVTAFIVTGIRFSGLCLSLFVRFLQRLFITIQNDLLDIFSC